MVGNYKEYSHSPMFRFLMILVVSSTFCFQGWRIQFNNFAKELLFLNGEQVGMVQSLREVAGFMTFLVVFVLLIMREHKLSSISVVIMGIGTFMTGFFPSFSGLLLSTFVMSIGFHFFETTNQSLPLQYFSRQDAPKVMGLLKGNASLANILAGVVVYLLASWGQSMQTIFAVLGSVAILTGLLSLRSRPANSQVPEQHKKMIIRKRYWLYYTLHMLSGARRQIFVVFAVFLLVEKFHFTVQEIAVLFVINNLLGIYVNPLIGRLIGRFGEKKTLTFEYACLFLIFLAYAVVENRYLAGALYILDHLFFPLHIGIRTYFQKIADTKDLAASTSVGFAINHIAAVVIPIVGGIQWLYDSSLPFYTGAGLCLVSLFFVRLIRLPQNANELGK